MTNIQEKSVSSLKDTHSNSKSSLLTRLQNPIKKPYPLASDHQSLDLSKKRKIKRLRNSAYGTAIGIALGCSLALSVGGLTMGFSAIDQLNNTQNSPVIVHSELPPTETLLSGSGQIDTSVSTNIDTNHIIQDGAIAAGATLGITSITGTTIGYLTPVSRNSK